MEDLTHISLFAGIGGIDIATEWAGFRTILFVEIDPYCQKVLKKHWPDVPIIGDIRDATKEKVMAYAESRQSREQEAPNRGQDTGGGSEEESMAGDTESNRSEEVKGISQGQDSNTRGVYRADERARRDAPIPPVTLITGGFPCQPVSVAGKRRGKEDDRWLWPDMLRVISKVRPAWVVAENVTGLLHMGFYDCLSDLESEGYETIPFVIPACGVNAPHRRDRIFIVAVSKSKRWRGWGDEDGGESNVQAKRPSATGKQGLLADTECGEVRDGRAIGRTTNQGGGTTKTGGEAICPRKEIPLSGDAGQGGQDVADTNIGGEEWGQSENGQRERIKQISKDAPDSDRSGCQDRTEEHRGEQAQKKERVGGTSRPSAVPDTAEQRPYSEENESILERAGGCKLYPGESRDYGGDWWAVEPDVGRVVDGLSSELDIARQIRDWCRNEYSNNKKAKSERDRLTRLFLRSVWEHRKLAKTSPQSYIRAVQDSVSEVPLRDTQSRWYLGAWIEETQSLCDMWKQFYTSPQQEPQDLQYKLLERAREIKRPKTVASRVDRLKCLGNAVVPQQIYPILKAIADIENGHCD